MKLSISEDDFRAMLNQIFSMGVVSGQNKLAMVDEPLLISEDRCELTINDEAQQVKNNYINRLIMEIKNE